MAGHPHLKAGKCSSDQILTQSQLSWTLKIIGLQVLRMQLSTSDARSSKACGNPLCLIAEAGGASVIVL